MTGRAELVVGVAAGLYQARDSVRGVLGERFASVMANHAVLIRRVAEAKGIELAAAATLLAEEATANQAPFVAAQMLAALVEMTEPSTAEAPR